MTGKNDSCGNDLNDEGRWRDDSLSAEQDLARIDRDPLQEPALSQGALQQVEVLLRAGVDAHRRRPDGDRSTQLLALLRRRRRIQRWQFAAWASAAAIVIGAVLWMPSDLRGPAEAEVEAARLRPSVAPELQAASIAEVALELSSVRHDAAAAGRFLSERVPLLSRYLSR